ncbi:MAG: hypothetical protein VW835_18490, partial [Rickettsiales bacterium]
MFVPKTYSDAHPGAECGIAPALPFLHLEQNPGDDSKSDYGGIVQVEAGTGRMYIDVVLPNQKDATETHLSDAWEDLEATAAYTLCLRKAPTNTQRLRSLRHRQRMLAEWWEDGSTDGWTHLGNDWIHVLDPLQPPSTPPSPPLSPPYRYGSASDANGACLAAGCTGGLASVSMLDSLEHGYAHLAAHGQATRVTELCWAAWYANDLGLPAYDGSTNAEIMAWRMLAHSS